MISQASVVAYLLAYMEAFAPNPERVYKSFPTARESAEERATRFRSMAEDAAAVAMDENNPNLYPEAGEIGRVHSALVLIAISRYESNYRKDIDKGIPPFGLGDNGRSFCSMQIMMHRGQTRPYDPVSRAFVAKPGPGIEVFKGPELLANRRVCYRVGLRTVKHSYGACGQNHLARFRSYASGSCDKAANISARRVRHIEGYWESHRFVDEGEPLQLTKMIDGWFTPVRRFIDSIPLGVTLLTYEQNTSGSVR